MHIQTLAGKWQFRQVGSEEWLPAQVPGGVHTDLLTAGRIPDPFVADNEKRVQWVAESDWEYRCTFASTDLVADEKVFLVCDGLDTLAEVTLNGQLLGKTDNMFRQYRWEVKRLLRKVENELVILFRSPVQYITARQAERPLRGPRQSIPGGPYLRKAPCQFGWDWGPQLPPIGIWKDIRLEGRSVARWDDVHLRQHHKDGKVTIEARLTVERWRDAPLTAKMRVTEPEGSVAETQVDIAGTGQTLQVPIAQPQLWWPHGYGHQPLYKVDVLLLASDQLYDQRTYQIGLRTVELRREDDEWGQSFTFVVNGVPIFAKGANWIPADSFPTRISDEHLEGLIRSAVAVHQNMLRIWGGGFYEEERFYDLCDQYGILVWQDFIFSCSVYPEEEAFLENVRVEAVENIRRLRHRASLALWCGNNEMEGGWVAWGWDVPELQDLKGAYDRFFHHILPELCAAEDPDHPYWPSSPSSNTPFVDPNGVRAGDTHNWEVWHGNRPFKAYREHNSRFVSEFGFQSLPALETIRTYADESEWNMTSYIMEHHQRNEVGNTKIITYMTDHFRLPQDFKSLVYLTQLLQAEAVCSGVEYWRRNRQRTSGTLYWQLNDCWPVASWASLDYFGRWKALHYAARRFYAPLLLSAEDWWSEAASKASSDPVVIRWSAETLEGDVLETGELRMSTAAVQRLIGSAPPSTQEWKPKVTLHLTSDLTTDQQATVRWSLVTLAGEVLQAGEESVTAPALNSTCVCELDFTDRVSADPSTELSTGNRREVVLVYELWQDDERLSMGVVPFSPNKHLLLTDPALAADLRQDGDQLAVDVTAQSLARFVELALDGADVVFSDNYFDVPAGRTVTVSCPLPNGWTLEQARAALRVRSLYDSFASSL
jgi:beta-mannosidase